MYIVYSDGEPIYSPNLTQHGYILINGKIVSELNKAGSFEFLMPTVNPGYSKILKMKSTITVEENGEEIWRGRILEETKDFYKNKKVVCEGELAFLNDVIVSSYDYSTSGTTVSTYFNFLMNQYNSNCSSYRVLRAGNVVISDSNRKIYPKLDGYSDVLSELNKNILETLGGYLLTRRESGVTYIDYYENIERSIDQVIQFGKNLIDFEEYINAAQVYTYLIPIGNSADGKTIDITSVNSGKNYIYSEKGENLFGKIWGTITFEGVETPSVLLTEGKKQLEKAIEMASTITINAVDLTDLGVDVSRIKLGYQTPVISIPHDVDSNFLCSKTSLSLDDPSQNEYTLGLNFEAISDAQAKTFKNANNAINETKNVSKQIGQIDDSISGIKNGNVYKAGDSIKTNEQAFVGYITSSRQDLLFTIPVGKIISASIASITSGKIVVRGVDGYLNSNNSNGNDVSEFQLFNADIGESTITFRVRKSDLWGDKNNTPVAVHVLNLAIKFS